MIVTSSHRVCFVEGHWASQMIRDTQPIEEALAEKLKLKEGS